MIVGWLILACSSPAPGDDGPVAHALEDPAFRFCHVDGADLDHARRWCARLDEIPEERCPGLHATCAGAPEAPESGCQRDPARSGGDGQEQLASAPEKPREPWSWESAVAPENLAFVGEILRWVMAIVVAAGILVLFRYLMTRFGFGAAAEAPAAVAREVEVDEEELDQALPEVPSAPSDRLLALARAALEEGRAGDAVVLARGAALRALGEAGRLRLHRSRTDREYVRALEGEHRAALRVVVSMVEVFRFGKRSVGADAARDALVAAERILRTLGVLLVVWASSPAWAQTPSRYTTLGDAALFELFTQRGYDVSWRLRPLEDLGADDADALVLDMDGVGTEVPWEHLRAWVEDGHVLWVVGDASAGFPELGAWAWVADPGSVQVAGPLVGAGYAPLRTADPSTAVWVDHQGAGWIVGDAGDPLIVVPLGEGVLVALADPVFTTNGAWLVPANEALVGDLLYLGQARAGWPLPTPARVQLATRVLVGSDQQPGNPFESLARAELLPFVVQFLLFWSLLGLWRGWPFAAPRDPADEGRIRFSEHVEALGERYRRLKAGRHVLAAYADLWLHRLGPKGLQLAAVASGMERAEAEAFVAELERRVAEPHSDRPDPDDELRVMERLWTVVEHRSEQDEEGS